MLPIKISFNRAMIGSIVALTTFLTVSAEEFEARYWFDLDSDNCHTCTVNSSTGQLSIAVDQLSNKALHQLNFQIRKADGEWSTVYTQFFNVGCSSDLSLSYTFDGLASKYPLDMSDPVLDVSAILDGLHRVCIADNNGYMTPGNQMFYKTSVPENNLMLVLSSTRDNVVKQLQVSSDDKGVSTIDVSDLQPGVYPVNMILRNTSNAQTIASVTSLINITSVGGDRISEIYYWLDDSTTHRKEIVINEGSLPFTYSEDIDVSEFNIPTSDCTMAMGNEGPVITPKFNLGVSVLTNNGFQADTTAYFTDNSKTGPVDAVTLKSGEQYDFGMVNPGQILWAKFPVQENDEIRFVPRWESSAKLFDNNAVPLDTLLFDSSNKDATFKATTTGMYYTQLYDIYENLQDFAVKMTYVNGPSSENAGGSFAEYEGILVDWESADQWSGSESELRLDKNGIRLEALKMGSTLTPEVAERTNLCKTYQSNKLVFSSGQYIDKVTLCVPSECVIPQIDAAEGSVTIDRDANIVVWEGLSNTVDLTVKKYRSSDMTDEISIPELLLQKAYVRLSDIDDSVYVTESDQIPEDFDYVGYNCMRIWDNGNKVGEYSLNDKISMTFDNSLIRVMNNGVENTHEIKDHLIITYSNDPSVSGIDTPELAHPSVMITGEAMEFSGLPNFVGIYALDGRTIFQRYVDTPDFNYPLHDLVPGIYIVKVGNLTTKMLIK